MTTWPLPTKLYTSFMIDEMSGKTVGTVIKCVLTKLIQKSVI